MQTIERSSRTTPPAARVLFVALLAGMGFALLGAMLSVLRLSRAGARGAAS